MASTVWILDRASFRAIVAQLSEQESINVLYIYYSIKNI